MNKLIHAITIPFLFFSSYVTALNITVEQGDRIQIITLSGLLQFPNDGSFLGAYKLKRGKDIDLILNSGGEIFCLLFGLMNISMISVPKKSVRSKLSLQTTMNACLPVLYCFSMPIHRY